MFECPGPIVSSLVEKKKKKPSDYAYGNKPREWNPSRGIRDLGHTFIDAGVDVVGLCVYCVRIVCV